MTFNGELMVCIMSGEKKRSNPNIESGWDCLVLDGNKYYVSKKWRDKSYRKRGVQKTMELMLRKAAQLKRGGK